MGGHYFESCLKLTDQVVDLNQVFKVNKKGEVLLYKEMQVGSSSLSLEARGITLPVFANVPACVRVTFPIPSSQLIFLGQNQERILWWTYDGL